MSTAEVIFEGLYFGEGPRWRDGRLWLSDFYAHAVFSIDPAGNIRTELELDDAADPSLSAGPRRLDTAHRVRPRIVERWCRGEAE